MFAKALLTTALISAVSAHQNWHQLWINDVTPGYQVGIRMPPSNSPVTDVTSNDLACNVNGSIVPSGVQTVAANEGDTIKVQWDSSSHPGPITHFLYGPVDDASQATGIGAGWFKIDELDAVNGTWANEIMVADNMTHEFKLPTGLASGEYLLRSEMLALHGAQTLNGAQFYIGCAQLKISGTGSEGACSPTISLPGAYKADDDDIYIPNVYNGFDISTYTAPGGPVATCGGSGSSTPVATSAPVASNSTAIASATAAPVTSSVAPTSVVVETPNITSVESTVAEPTVTETPVSDYSSVESPPIVVITSAPVASGVIPVPSGNVTSALPTLLPSTFATLVRPSSQAAAPTGSNSTGVAKIYYQCGGNGWTGPTACAEGATCVKQNDFYSQCLKA